MLRPFLLFLILVPACGSKASDTPSASTTRAMHIENGGWTWVTFETVHAKGRIDIAPEVRVDYTYEPDEGGTFQRARLTVDGKLLDFDGPVLKIGDKSYGNLAGEVKIQIGGQGVTVNGEKR